MLKKNKHTYIAAWLLISLIGLLVLIVIRYTVLPLAANAASPRPLCANLGPNGGGLRIHLEKVFSCAG
jgi:hypothetical protein